MSRYAKPLLIMSIVLIAGYMLWPVFGAHVHDIKRALIHFHRYCMANPLTGYTIYGTALSLILLAGLPISTAAMLLAGVFYNFWEATTLITICRLNAAMVAFFLVRHTQPEPAGRRSRFIAKPSMIRLLERHPSLGLFLARLAPIPDGVVNYTLAAAPIRQREYMLVSLLGMIPFTVFCVWMGQQLGTISTLMRYIY